MMLARLAPMVRRMAMSAVLVRTSMTRLDTMLKAATSTIIVRTRKITLVCATTAEKPTLAWNQSNTQALRADRLHEQPARLGRRSAIRHEHLDARDVGPEVEHVLGVLQRRVHEVGIVVVHAGAEDRGDLTAAERGMTPSGVATDTGDTSWRRLRPSHP